MKSVIRIVLLVSVCGLFHLGSPAWGQATASDPAIDMADLKLMLQPLTADDLVAESDAWRDLVKAKAMSLAAAKIAERTAGGAASPEVAGLTTERNALIDRTNMVLDELEAKGGDPAPYRDYIKAATSLAVDVTDVASAGRLATQFKDWLISAEGGIKLGGNIVLCLVVLIAFWILGRIVAGLVGRAVGKLEQTSALLRKFLVNLTRNAVYLVGVIMALGMLGINVGPLVAVAGAATFVLGFALQGTLSNFAAGVMVLIYRPFDIGNVINAAGVTGKVDAMTLVSTTIKTPDNQTIIIPNGSIWGGVITNITGNDTRRVDLVFGIGYDDDIEKAKGILEELARAHPLTLDDPAPVVKVHELADSSVNFICRPWSKTSDYWDVFWDLTSQVKARFDAEGISIPFPQRDVHVYQEKA